jgi:hypothetical protein
MGAGAKVNRRYTYEPIGVAAGELTLWCRPYPDPERR